MSLEVASLVEPELASPVPTGSPRYFTVLRVIGRTLLDIVLVLWAAATLTFIALQLIPGDPLDKLLSGIQDATPEMRAAIAAHYGLDQPVIVQYFTYLAGIARGDLGMSYQQGTPVTR